MSVTFVVPDVQGPLFWQTVTDVAKAAAKSLEIELEVIYSEPNRFATLEWLKKIAARKAKPDYVIFRPFYGNTRSLFETLENQQIDFVTLEEAFTGDVATRIGKPREKYQHWLGEVLFNNKQGGQLLLDALVKAHQQIHSNEQANIVGIGGDYDQVSTDRQSSLQHLISNKTTNIHVQQIFPLYWNPVLLKQRFSLIYNRYPDTNIYWCASDQLALELISEYQKISDKPIIVGGFDWIPHALTAIENGQMTASVGGHFLMVAKALLKIVDYQHKLDSFKQNELENYELITRENVHQYWAFIQKRQWHFIDYKKFLRTKTNSAKPLTTANMLLQLKAPAKLIK